VATATFTRRRRREIPERRGDAKVSKPRSGGTQRCPARRLGGRQGEPGPKASKSVRGDQHRADKMTKPDDHLPLQRSYLEQRIGQLVGIFQIDRHQPADSSEARALPPHDGVVGLVAVANGGRLSETAFNVWTVGSQMFKEGGCPDTQRIDFNLSEYSRRLWGANGRSGSLRRRVADAITELLKTRVVVMGVDPYTLEPAEGASWELNLLEAAGARSDMQPVFEAARRGDRQAVAQLASLSWRSTDDKATWSMVLPKWLADSVRRDQGVILDYEVQRSLRGAAKRIWVQLESYPGWRSHQLVRPDGEQELLASVNALTDDRAALTVEPGEHEDSIEVHTLVLPLDADVYEAFGLTHANRKRALQAACTSILSTDLTYLRADVLTAPRSKRHFELHLARAAGSLRQERHRTALRRRAGHPPPKPKEETVRQSR